MADENVIGYRQTWSREMYAQLSGTSSIVLAALEARVEDRVPPSTKAKRRAANRAARKQRRANRRG